MARTQTQILEAIRADFVSNITLQEAYGLDPEKSFNEQFSTVSLEAIWTFIVASAIYLLELIIDSKQAEIDTKINSKQAFSIPWYQQNALAFQLGDELTLNPETYQYRYPEQNEDKKIVKHASVRTRTIDGVSKLQVYIAKENKEALSSAELDAFADYYSQTGAPGTHFDFISLAPDSLTINLAITYNPQLLSASGELLSNATSPVNEAIEGYLNSLRYTGKFSRTKLIDSVQKAPGVLDALLGDVLMNGEAANVQLFESPSGFFTADSIIATYTRGNVDDY